MLDRVLDRRRGIPITLSVVLIEGRPRLGVAFTGIGAPATSSSGTSAAGVPRSIQRWPRARRDRAGPLYGAAPLEPSDSIAIVSRMLANLKAIYAQRGDAGALRWVIRLRVLLPAPRPASALSSSGSWPTSTRGELGRGGPAEYDSRP
jgi:hypothetical protein